MKRCSGRIFIDWMLLPLLCEKSGAITPSGSYGRQSELVDIKISIGRIIRIFTEFDEGMVYIYYCVTPVGFLG